MTELFIYLAVALGFSFFCSIAEAVLLSVTTAYVKLLEQQQRPSATVLQKLKADIDSPLAAILSLNTIAHTVGAAGVGAQAAKVFGSQYLGVTSAVLTLLILVFSEIIPKTLGAAYWRKLAPSTAYALKYLIVALYPLVWMSKLLTRRIKVHPTLEGFSRDEFAAMASLGEKEGQLSEQEADIMKNLLSLSEARVEDAMTPRTVIFSLPQDNTVELFFNKHDGQRFTRIPVYADSPDNITGFVLRGDLLLASARGNASSTLENYSRPLLAVPDKISLLAGFELLLEYRTQMMYVVDEYGDLQGLITLEDILETLMGKEFVDESGQAEDMQKLAKSRWRKRAREMGVELSNKQD